MTHTRTRTYTYTETCNPYKLFRPVSDEMWPYLRHEVLAWPTTPIQDGAGHPGKGYNPGWITGLSNGRMDWYNAPETISTAITALHSRLSEGWRVDQIMVNRMDPGGVLRPHRDGGAGMERVYRFHLPVTTNDHVFFWDEIQDRFLHLEERFWHGPIPYQGVMHSMENNGDTERVHLIVDLQAPK